MFGDVDDFSEREVKGLTEETYTKYTERDKLLEVYQKNVDNPKVIDDWAFLDNIKVWVEWSVYGGVCGIMFS